MAASARQCQVCCQAPSKYKCPSCYLPYCSLACFKRHKEIPCAKPTPSVKKPMVDREEPKGRPLSVDDPSEVVLQEQLKSVAACSEIRNAVTNEDLQRLIRKIESSEDAESELDKAMEGDVFRIFTDKILSAINP
ncbi:zinc finger HIT domain-containing protein 3-like [Punica granatum]|uniref:Zinc finger HIT domain-containing protein 3-like n=1 Tax=Punica granatum TaxID=22663 RepID=A0A6P8BMM3_PUNGR|nr:zinc finger HIT domain-containing protein 3-like [Punica granatum]XP_031371727.1 zinc finger HIT domain-containing protein 3-like [Punica granatum]